MKRLEYWKSCFIMHDYFSPLKSEPSLNILQKIPHNLDLPAFGTRNNDSIITHYKFLFKVSSNRQLTGAENDP